MATIMLRRTPLCAAAEFKQKTRWSFVWPNMHYGAMFLPYTAGRQIPMKGVNWVTRDSNRLTSFHERYSSVIADLDTQRNEEELNIPLNDIRWNDHRRVYWRCSFCGARYRKSVSVRTKFHAGCNLCKGRFPSEVLREQTVSAPLRDHYPALVDDLTDADKRDNLSTLSETSKYNAEWKCASCGQPYRASVRSRTGCVEAGQCPLHPQSTQWTAYCPSCTWAANLTPIAEQAKREGQYLGLEASVTTVSSSSSLTGGGGGGVGNSRGGKGRHAVSAAAAAIPRRKKLVS